MNLSRDALRREIFSRRRAATRNLQSATRCDAKSSVGDALRRGMIFMIFFDFS